MKHRYCCQNAAQNYLHHIIPVPDDVDVNPDCLFGIERHEFICGLKELTDIIKRIYGDMIEVPSEYGMPLVDDIVYVPPNPKAADSEYAVNRVVTILFILVQSGELSDNGIMVDKDKFKAMLKEKRSRYFKISKANMILDKLREFGFVFEYNQFTYPDNYRVIRALYGYMKNVKLNRDSLMSLNYHLIINPKSKQKNTDQMIFAEYLSGADKELFLWINEVYSKAGFYCVNPGYHFMLDYHLNQKERKRALRIRSQNGMLQVSCKLYHVSTYSELIEKASEEVKAVFCNMPVCSPENCIYKRNTCICRVDYMVDGQFYKACTYENFYYFDGFRAEDAEFFKYIFSVEAKQQQCR